MVGTSFLARVSMFDVIIVPGILDTTPFFPQEKILIDMNKKRIDRRILKLKG